MLSEKKTAIPQLGLHPSHNNVPIHKVYRLGIENNKLSEGYKDSFSLFSTINIKLLLNHLKTDFLKINAFNAKTYIVNNFEKFENEEFIENVSIKKDNIQTKQIKIIPQKEKDFNQLQQQIENDTYSILAKSISLNETISYIDNDFRKNGYRVHIDINSKTINYIYSIYYKDTSGVIVRSNNKIKTSDDYRAIIVKTAGVETLFFFLEEVYGTDHANAIRLGIFERIKIELEKTNDVKTLAFLYKNLPNYIKLGYNDESEIQTRPYKLPDELLWKHLILFANFDKGSKDASYYVVNTMSLITPKFCIKEFLKDQSLVTKIYNGLDDQNAIETLFGVYEFSKTFEGGAKTFEPTNKDFFISLLHSYAQLLEMNSQVTTFESSGVHFHQGNKKGGKYDAEIKFTLNSNILFSDEYKNKVFIKNYWEGKKYLGQGYDQQGNVHDLYEYGRGINEYGYYNPLDLVKFTQYNDKGEAITMNTYALFVKYASDVKEWEKVNEGIRLGFNVLMIIGSVATLASGVGSLLFYAAIADMGLASADIIIQGNKDKEYFRTKEGKEFLESWEKIYAVGSLVTFSPVAIKAVLTYAPKLVSSGAKLLQIPGKIITNPEIYKKVKDLTTKAIYSLEIPHFNKKSLEILKVGFTEFAQLKNAEKLQKLGVIFVKGGEDTVAAIYKGVVIASGKVENVSKKLFYALEKYKGEKLKIHLEQLSDLSKINKITLRKIVYSGGQRGEKALTIAQRNEIVEYVKKYGLIEEDIIFCDEISDFNTSYGLMFGKDFLYINTDVLPGVLGTANSRLSWRAALAHELEGHRKAALNNKTFYNSKLNEVQNLLLEEMQASIRSSEHGFELSKSEKYDLLMDAKERFENHKNLLNGTIFENKNFEQIKEILWISKI